MGESITQTETSQVIQTETRHEIDASWREFLRDIRDDFRRMAASMNEVHERLSRVETNVQHIATKQDGADNFEKRISLLEKGQENILSDAKRRGVDMRWYIGLIVAAAAVVVPVLASLFGHLHFK